MMSRECRAAAAVAVGPELALGNVLFQDGRFDDAVKSYERAIELSIVANDYGPATGMIYSCLVVVHEKMGATEKAAEARRIQRQMCRL